MPGCLEATNLLYIKLPFSRSPGLRIQASLLPLPCINRNPVTFNALNFDSYAKLIDTRRPHEHSKRLRPTPRSNYFLGNSAGVNKSRWSSRQAVWWTLQSSFGSRGNKSTAATRGRLEYRTPKLELPALRPHTDKGPYRISHLALRMRYNPFRPICEGHGSLPLRIGICL